MRRPASQIAAVMMFVAVVADRCIPIYSGCKKKSTDYYRLLVSTIKRFMFQLITTTPLVCHQCIICASETS